MMIILSEVCGGYETNYSNGTFLPFDDSDVETLGDGLIDHSAKELISSLVYMNLLPRFRYLLGQKGSGKINEIIYIMGFLPFSSDIFWTSRTVMRIQEIGNIAINGKSWKLN